MATELTVGQLIQSLARHDRAGMLAGLDPDVQLRALLPPLYMERTGAVAVADEMLGWFDDVPEIAVEQARAEPLADLWHAEFRFGLRGLTPGRVVEQHWYCTVADGAVTGIRLLCSGFRPVSPEPVPARVMDALGDGCATLTPRIAAALRELAQGEVLSVLTDDPASTDDLAAWSRLTGHEIVATTPEPNGVRFYLRHN